MDISQVDEVKITRIRSSESLYQAITISGEDITVNGNIVYGSYAEVHTVCIGAGKIIIPTLEQQRNSASKATRKYRRIIRRLRKERGGIA